MNITSYCSSPSQPANIDKTRKCGNCVLRQSLSVLIMTMTFNPMTMTFDLLTMDFVVYLLCCGQTPYYV